MRTLLQHKGYEVCVQPVAGELFAIIREPRRRVGIPEIPAVSEEAGERALIPLAKAAIERDLQMRSRG